MRGEKQKDCSFCLMPGKKLRQIAGPFDLQTRLPLYDIQVSSPSHVRQQIEISQILFGTPGNCQWAWDIKNNSSEPVFLIIKEDGKKI